MFNFPLYATQNVPPVYMPQAYRIQLLFENALRPGNRVDVVTYINDLHVIANATHCGEIARMAMAAAAVLVCHLTPKLRASSFGVGLA